MRTPPRHMKPTKRSSRSVEKSIEAAKKAKLKEAALLEKYEKQAEKLRQKTQKEQERAFKHVPVEAPSTKPAVASADEWEEEPEKRKGGVFFTVAGIIFLLIAVLMTLWQFGFLDKLLQKPVPKPTETSVVSVVTESVPADNSQTA